MNTAKKKAKAQLIVEELETLFPEVTGMLTWSTPWELVIAVALSAQTTDKQVNKVTPGLFAKYPTLQHYLDADLEEFRTDINTIGFYKTKAKHILAAAKILHDEFGGVVPQTIAELIKLPGVGRKTANVVLSTAFGITEGIAVDTHVVRLANKFGLTKESDPKKIEKDLMEIIPKDHWRMFTKRMINYGREYSPAHKKHDDSDPISQKLRTL